MSLSFSLSLSLFFSDNKNNIYNLYIVDIAPFICNTNSEALMKLIGATVTDILRHVHCAQHSLLDKEYNQMFQSHDKLIYVSLS